MKRLILILLLMATTAHAEFNLFGSASLMGGSAIGYTSYYAAFLNSLTTKGTSTTHTRASFAATTDNNGIVTYTATGIPQFPGMRAVTNHLLQNNNITLSPWANSISGTGSSNPVVTNDYSIAPDGTQTADRVQLNRGSAAASYCLRWQTLTTFSAGKSAIHSVWVKTADDSTKTIFIGDAISGGTPFTVDGTWKRITAYTRTTATNYFEISLRQSFGSSETADLLVWRPMYEDGTGNPSYSASEWQESTTTPTTSYYAQTLDIPAITTFGDSLTGAGLNGYTAWPEVMAQNMPATVLNRAVSGYTSSQVSTLEQTPYPSSYNHVNIIYAGYNDISFTAGGLCTTLKTNIATIVSRINTNRFIILSVPTGTLELSGSAAYNRIVGCNSDLATLYPDNYYDMRAYLVSLYNPAVPQDVTDHGNDILPSTLRHDGIHPNQLGHNIVAAKVKELIESKSWYSTLFVPAGSSIPAGKGILSEPAATNIYSNPLGPATQTITVTAAQHVLSFYGTGTLTLSGTSTAGPLVGTGVNNRVQLAFTPTAGGLTLTQTGTITSPQLELSPMGQATSPALSTAATTTRALTVITGTPTPSATLNTANTRRLFSGEVTFGGYVTGTDYAIVSSYVDASNYTALIYNGSTSMIFRKRIAGTNYDATATITAPTIGQTYAFKATVNADNTTSIVWDGGSPATQSNTTAPQFKSDGTFQIGSLNGGNNAFAQFKNVKVTK